MHKALMLRNWTDRSDATNKCLVADIKCSIYAYGYTWWVLRQTMILICMLSNVGRLTINVYYDVKVTFG